MRLSLCSRKERTHPWVPNSTNSGWSSSFQAGSSLRRNSSNLRRCNSAWAVSTKNALRPRGPTSASISRRRSSGRTTCALCSPISCTHCNCDIEERRCRCEKHRRHLQERTRRAPLQRRVAACGAHRVPTRQPPVRPSLPPAQGSLAVQPGRAALPAGRALSG